MKTSQSESKNNWQKTSVPNLTRFVSSGILFARIRVKGKLIRRSLKTKVLSVARLRLADTEKTERQMADHAQAYEGGKMTFGDALAMFRERLRGDASLKPRTKAHREERISVILKTWPGIESTDVRKITKQDCLMWAAKYKTSAGNFNKTVQTLRVILNIPMESGIRYDNSAQFIKAMKVRTKPLQLPSRVQFQELIKCVRVVNKRFSSDAADLIEFLAYGGFRKSEAQNIRWADCNFERGEILVRGDEETGTKNWTVRTVPMIPEMRLFIEKLKAKRPDETADTKIMRVSECGGSLANACLKLSIPHITHHDLRHLFATTCIESNVDIPTVSRWLGHQDGGALAMKVYGHLRDQHSTNMAQRVAFAESPLPKVEVVTQSAPPKASKTIPQAKASKTIPQAKAKYSYPWWASSEAIEVFWGQANETVQIVPTAKFLESAKAAMGREVFEQELAEPQALLDELAERVVAAVIEKVKLKISGNQKTPAA